MPFEINIDDANRIIEVVAHGSASLEEHKQARIEAAMLLRHHGYKSLLVDLQELHTKGSATTMTCFDFGTTYLNDGIPVDCLIAHVIPADTSASKDVEFVSTVASNRGGIIQEFDTLEQSRQWLTSTSIKPANTTPTKTTH